MSNPTCNDRALMRLRYPIDKYAGKHHQNDTHWCQALATPTTPLLFRCGGDDFKPKVKPVEIEALS